jgi:hypothetical protein
MKFSGKSIQMAVTALASVLALTACGGSGNSAPATPGGTTGAAVSQGTVTAKTASSVTVNGILFSTAGAVVKIDDNPSAADLLQVGMTVKVRATGTIDDNAKTGIAHDIEARDALEGQITALGANTITVMGQTVQIEDNLTRLNDDDTVKVFAAAGFALGNFVEVHGFADDQGGLRATRVAKKVSGEFESKGFVVAPITATSFGLSRIQGGTSFITVNFAAPFTAPALNSLVEVKSAAAPVAGAITATLIHPEDRLGAENEKVEVEGIVSSGTVASFVVNGQPVITSASTVFEGGTSSDFAIGLKLEAEGQLVNGAIVASKISFRSNIKIEADASNVTAASLTVLGKTVGINQFTRVDNGPVANASHVEVQAILDRNNNLIATRIKVLSASAKAFLQGPVTAFDGSAGTLVILGSTLSSDASTQWRASSTSSEVAVTKAAFFAQLKANVSVVKVRWDNFTAISAPFKEAEIELGK